MFHFSSEFSLIFSSRPLWAYTCINENYFWICLWVFLSVFIDFMRLVLGFWKRFFDPFICIIIPSHTLSTFCQTSYLCSRFLRLTTNFPSLLKYAHLSQNFITSPCSQLSPNPVVEKKKKFSCSLLHMKCYANFGYIPKGWEKRWLEEIIGKQPLPSHL